MPDDDRTRRRRRRRRRRRQQQRTAITCFWSVSRTSSIIVTLITAVFTSALFPCVESSSPATAVMVARRSDDPTNLTDLGEGSIASFDDAGIYDTNLGPNKQKTSLYNNFSAALDVKPSSENNGSTDPRDGIYVSTYRVNDDKNGEKPNKSGRLKTYSAQRKRFSRGPSSLSKTLRGSDGLRSTAAHYSVDRSDDNDDDKSQSDNGENIIMTSSYGSKTLQMFRPIEAADNLLQASRLPSSSVPAGKHDESHELTRTVTNYGISWLKIGLIALVKLGLVKLKAIGFVKFLSFFLFKLKVLAKTVFFKLLLLSKFFKFLKFLVLPVFLLPLLSLIALSAILYPASAIDTAAAASFPYLLSDRITGGTETPAQYAAVTEQTILLPGSVSTVMRPSQGFVNAAAGTEIPDSLLSYLDGVLTGNGGVRYYYDTSAMLDPTLKLFQKELSSEKCIERVACKMATTGKASIIPLWINWVLHRVSKLVPNNKLLHYLETYVSVIDEIHSDYPPNPDNWETWCSERFDCNSYNEKNDLI